MVVFPHSADFITTSRCNLRCPVCWGSGMPYYDAAPLFERFCALDVLKRGGVMKAVFTGGEPLVEPSTIPMAVRAKASGMETLLFTNALRFPELSDRLLPYVDYVSFSLDGYDETSNSLARGPGQFDSVMESLDILQGKGKKVQVLTVVTRQNKGFIRDIGELLETHTSGLRFHWKLNHHKPLGRYSERYRMGYGDFQDLAEAVKQEFRGRLKVRYSIPEHDNAYLFVFPDNSLYTTQGSEYVYLGNVLGDYDAEMMQAIEENMCERSKRVKL